MLANCLTAKFNLRVAPMLMGTRKAEMRKTGREIGFKHFNPLRGFCIVIFGETLSLTIDAAMRPVLWTGLDITAILLQKDDMINWSTKRFGHGGQVGVCRSARKCVVSGKKVTHKLSSRKGSESE